MRVLVLIKSSLDVSEIKVDPVTKELRLSGVPEKIGDIDKNVVEAAAQLTAGSEATLQAVSLGALRAKDGFRDILAMGVDEVFLIEDPFNGQADATVAVGIFEFAIQKLGPFDLIMCGFASDDGYTFQVAPRLAERLGLPLVAYVRKMTLEDGSLKATRELDDAVQVVTVPLPAVVSIAEEAFPPRRITLLQAMQAKKKPVHIWGLGDLGLVTTELSGLNPYKEIQKTGIVVNRKQEILKGLDLHEVADRLIDQLIEEKILSGGPA
ncbi:MAG: electron transfer flavoprotein subunit beta/FixA family protein [Anaerolineales bacterium]|nr:electron transfer flavoprotein subunit beta/FixA family protein [Anaerolineales bacterium]